MLLLQLVTNDQIRCPYCLGWNRNDNTLCVDCTGPIIELENFGAARALANWNSFNPKSIKSLFAAESQERITHWNEAFSVQYELLRHIGKDLPHLLQHTILDIRSEVERHLLSVFPLSAEELKEYQAYEMPGHELNERQRLQVIFQTHPSKLFRALAGFSLIQLGEGNETIFAYVLNWNAHYKKNKLERLLNFAHWSVQVTGYFNNQYSSHTSEIMPLLEKSDETSDWAKLFLYKGNYNTHELGRELENLINHQNLHIALSAALALRKYQSIHDLLVGQIHENTITLALRYSDERHIKDLLYYLNYAPASKQERIINRCITLKPGDPKIKTQIVQWLLKEGNIEFVDSLFSWAQIPMIVDVIRLLVNTTEGLDILRRSFIPWLKNNTPEELTHQAIQIILSTKSSNRIASDQNKMEALQREVQSIFYTTLCDGVRKKPTSKNTLELFQVLLQSHTLTARQVDDGLYALTKTDKILNNPLTEIFNNDGLSKLGFSIEYLHTFISRQLEDGDTNASTNNWLYTLYDILARKRELHTEPEVIQLHLPWYFAQAENNFTNKGTDGKFYKFCKTQKETILQNPYLINSLQSILETTNDAETKFWIEQTIINP